MGLELCKDTKANWSGFMHARNGQVALHSESAA